jgi:hypothetical protein
VVPEEHGVSAPPAPPRRERELLGTVAREFAALGYRTYLDPDGTDYFDLVVKRGEEVGLIEGKLRDGRRVLVQALERRAWGTWAAVAVASRRSAEAIVRRSEGTRAAPVGVYAEEKGSLVRLREPRPWVDGPDEDVFAPLRARFRRLLEAIDRGDVPAGATWSDVLREVRRASGGRGFAEWRLDEPGPG